MLDLLVPSAMNPPGNVPILARGFMELSTDREAASGVHPE
jgi:hypothetical protein